jgi:hypothetical protein
MQYGAGLLYSEAAFSIKKMGIFFIHPPTPIRMQIETRQKIMGKGKAKKLAKG